MCVLIGFLHAVLKHNQELRKLTADELKSVMLQIESDKKREEEEALAAGVAPAPKK